MYQAGIFCVSVLVWILSLTFSSFLSMRLLFIVNDKHCCDCELNLDLPLKDSPDDEVQTEQVLGMKEMVVPIFAGILSALRRVIARRVSLKVLILS